MTWLARTFPSEPSWLEIYFVGFVLLACAFGLVLWIWTYRHEHLGVIRGFMRDCFPPEEVLNAGDDAVRVERAPLDAANWLGPTLGPVRHVRNGIAGGGGRGGTVVAARGARPCDAPVGASSTKGFRR